MRTFISGNKYFFYVICVTIFSFDKAHSQESAKNWHFGYNAGITFNPTGVEFLSGSQMNAPEGCATISNDSGNLLFYSDGISIWDQTHQILPNAIDSLDGCNSSSQSALFIEHPNPDSSNFIFLFTTSCNEVYSADGFGSSGLSYSVIDKSLIGNGTLSNPLGDIILDRKNIFIYPGVNEKITGCIQANGCDYWIITHTRDTFIIYPLTQIGLGNPSIQKIGSQFNDPSNSFASFAGTGQLKVSPNTSKIAGVVLLEQFCEIFDFDNETGIVSNPIKIYMPNQCYGVEFSPNSSLLYVSADPSVYQFDLSAGNNATDIVNTIQFLGNGGSASLQLGSDDKIYIATQTNSLSVINSPDQYGSAGFSANNIDLSGKSSAYGLPNFIYAQLKKSNVKFYYSTPCLGDTTYFTNISPIKGAYTWSINEIAVSDNKDFSYVFTNAGTYQVALKVITECTTDSFRLNVLIAPDIDFEEEKIFCTDEEVKKLSVLSDSTAQYNWSTGDSSSFIYIDSAGYYYLLKTDSIGCSYYDSIKVQIIDCYDIFIPNIITPNNDGINDVFRILVHEKSIQDILVEVYDRTGKRIFSSNKLENTWDGSNNGKYSTNVYMYKIKLLFLNQENSIYKTGNVMVINH